MTQNTTPEEEEETSSDNATTEGAGRPVAMLEFADNAGADDIALVIDDHIEHSGLLRAVSNQDGTYAIQVDE